MAACWIARIAGLLFALFYCAFLIGEGPPPWSVYTLCWAAILSGLVLAWKWEGFGAAITLAGYVMFYLADRQFLAFSMRPLTAAPAVIAFVHVLSWFELGRRNRRPYPLPAAIWAGLALFLLLSINEVFGNPPLMTRRIPEPSIVGAWHSTDVALTLSLDGRLSGTVAGKRLSEARLTGNRTWFGKLMHWRTDYMINGRLEGQLVRGWVDVAGPALRADLLSGRKMRHFEVVR